MIERHVLLIFPTVDPRAFAALLERLVRIHPEKQIVTVAPPENRIGLAAESDRAIHLPFPSSRSAATPDLAAFDLAEVLVYAPVGGGEPLGLDLLHEIFSKPVERIVAVDADLRSRPYAPFRENRARVLAVFPGAMLPLHLGSHQRSFNLVGYLNRHGVPCDVLITSGTPKELPRLQSLLAAVCPRVHTYSNRKARLPLRRRAEQALERAWRRLRRRAGKPPELFSDRAFQRPTASARSMLAKLIDSEGYDTVIVNYAWMMDIVDGLSGRDRLRVIVDTHDVQFVRNDGLLAGEGLLFRAPAREKAAEIERLSRADTVLAISASDYSALRRALPGTDVRCVPSGFDYIMSAPRSRPADRPLRFGFIGSAMSANVRALEFVLDTWWPIIRQYSPASRLSIAGTIGRNPAIVERSFLDTSIDLLGVVPSLKDFYDRIDAVLSPVFVQGGLNFKSIETILAGKHLLTNRTGSFCLGDANLAWVVETAQDLTRALTRIEGDPAADLDLRRDRQRAAAGVFTGEHAYRPLMQILADATPATVHRAA